MDSAENTEQVRRAAAGDALALTMLLKNSRRELCAYLEQKAPPDLRAWLDADDLVQDTHVEVFRHIAEFVPREPDSFDRWVRVIAVRKLRDAIRWNRAARRGGGQPPQRTGATREDSMATLLDLVAGPGRSPSRSAAVLEATQAVQSAIETLPADYRHAVWLVYVEGRSVSVAAETMGRTERAIHGLCRRGLQCLREHLGDDPRYLSSIG